MYSIYCMDFSVNGELENGVEHGRAIHIGGSTLECIAVCVFHLGIYNLHNPSSVDLCSLHKSHIF